MAPTMFAGCSRSVSRVPGPPPRTSTAALVPTGGMTTVVPVSHPRPVRWWWPTAMPAMSVMSLRGPARRSDTHEVRRRKRSAAST